MEGGSPLAGAGGYITGCAPSPTGTFCGALVKFARLLVGSAGRKWYLIERVPDHATDGCQDEAIRVDSGERSGGESLPSSLVQKA